MYFHICCHTCILKHEHCRYMTFVSECCEGYINFSESVFTMKYGEALKTKSARAAKSIQNTLGSEKFSSFQCMNWSLHFICYQVWLEIPNNGPWQKVKETKNPLIVKKTCSNFHFFFNVSLILQGFYVIPILVLAFFLVKGLISTCCYCSNLFDRLL